MISYVFSFLRHVTIVCFAFLALSQRAAQRVSAMSLEGLPGVNVGGAKKPDDPQRRKTEPDIDPFVKSQAHLLTATDYNPKPTAVPPPIAANAGTLGVRHVLCVIGLPERGKPYIAKRLKSYLSFFHGADVQLFNIREYVSGPCGCDANAEALLYDLKRFMERKNEAAASNMSVPLECAEPSVGTRRSSNKDLEDDADERVLIDENDRRRKNVDSGKVAIIYSTDSSFTFKARPLSRSHRAARCTP